MEISEGDGELENGIRKQVSARTVMVPARTRRELFSVFFRVKWFCFRIRTRIGHDQVLKFLKLEKTGEWMIRSLFETRDRLN